jgi:hypothetical protein
LPPTLKFEDFANEVISVSQINAIHIFDTFQTFSLQVTAFAIGTNATWPFVAVPQFAVQADHAMERTGASSLSLTPFMKGSEQVEWEAFSVQNQGWVHAGFEHSGAIDEPPASISPYIFESFQDRTRVEIPRVVIAPDSILAPIWQIAPVVESYIFTNLNAVSYGYFERVYTGMVQAKTAVLSEVINLSNDLTQPPRSFMAAPVYQNNDEDSELVAMLTASLPWDSYFKNVLPEGIDGIFLVVSNTCNQTFSYLIDGPEISYLGLGDLHDPKYDDNFVVSGLTSFVSVQNCLYSFHLYPTEEFEEAYITNEPWVYTSVVVCIFLLTTVVFVVYDCLVERRLTTVMTTATRSNALVNSLFPANVRDRLMADEDNGKDEPKVSSEYAADFLSSKPIGKFLFCFSHMPVMQCFVA